jgi:inner membrane protein
MSPVTHFFAGWLVAGPTSLHRREKALVIAAGMAPDLDGLGIIPETLTRHSSHPLLWFSEYHHSLHTLTFALGLAFAAWLLSASGNFTLGPKIQGHPVETRPWTTALLCLLSFHLHLLGDLVGSRSPDGYQWPIRYLAPFSQSAQFTWHGQWTLNAWPNFAITIAFLVLTLWIAGKYTYSPFELVSAQANKRFLAVIKNRIKWIDGKQDPPEHRTIDSCYRVF